MQTYRQRCGRSADFRISYRFLPAFEGGRAEAPRQHIRFNFLYDGDGGVEGQQWMIWTEFLSEGGEMLPAGEVPHEGTADMFIFDRELVAYHMSRLTVGTKGVLMEGPNRVALCSVIHIGAPGANAL